MSTLRGVAWVSLSCLVACGDDPSTPGEGETRTGKQALHKSINPQNVESFPTNWFWNTRIRIYNPHSTYVDVHARCRRGGDQWFKVSPGGAKEESWGCGGTTLYVFNDAPPAPPGTVGYDIEVTTE